MATTKVAFDFLQMFDRDPVMLTLALIVSIVATVLGVSNLIGFVDSIEANDSIERSIDTAPR